jgi:hypothetical protein
MTVEMLQPHHSRIYEVTYTAAFPLGGINFQLIKFFFRDHVVLCKWVIPLSYTCLPAVLSLLVAFSLSLPDSIPALPSIKLALFLSSMKGGFRGLGK